MSNIDSDHVWFITFQKSISSFDFQIFHFISQAPRFRGTIQKRERRSGSAFWTTEKGNLVNTCISHVMNRKITGFSSACGLMYWFCTGLWDKDPESAGGGDASLHDVELCSHRGNNWRGGRRYTHLFNVINWNCLKSKLLAESNTCQWNEFKTASTVRW